MSIDIKESIEKINEVSRQLLSHILTLQNTNKNKTKIFSQSDISQSIPECYLAELMSERERLIHVLFEQKTTEEIAKELTLLNEMVSLNRELSNKSQECKKVLAEQVMRLKKSKKASKSYQKY